MFENFKTHITYAFPVVISIAFLFGIMWLAVIFKLWSASLTGRSELRYATYTKQIAIREAEAKRDSAILLAQAEVERAKGVAAANKIIGDSLKGNEDYLRYLWVDSLQQTKNQIIYIPTEAGLPILEATRKEKSVSTDKYYYR